MMNDKELKRNGSGYIDEPCYKAVTAPPRPGEIWLHAKSGAQMLVLANINGICPTLKLSDMADEGTVPVTSRTQMYVKPSMLAYCFENLLTTFVKTCKGNEMSAVRKGIIRALGLFDEVTQDNPMPEEYKALQDEVDSLKAQLKAEQATRAALPHDIIHGLEEKVRTLEDKNKSLMKSLAEAEKKAEDARFDLEAKNMADKMVCDSIAQMDQEIMKLCIYKDMYMDIIGKLVAVRGTANE